MRDPSGSLFGASIIYQCVVTHLGHTHARINEYEADYFVQHNQRDWRITDSQIRENKRASIGDEADNRERDLAGGPKTNDLLPL